MQGSGEGGTATHSIEHIVGHRCNKICTQTDRQGSSGFSLHAICQSMNYSGGHEWGLLPNQCNQSKAPLFHPSGLIQVQTPGSRLKCSWQQEVCWANSQATEMQTQCLTSNLRNYEITAKPIPRIKVISRYLAKLLACETYSKSHGGELYCLYITSSDNHTIYRNGVAIGGVDGCVAYLTNSCRRPELMFWHLPFY